MKPIRLIATAGMLALAFSAAGGPPARGRVTMTLDGNWDIEDSKDGASPPAAFGHRGPVPGLADLAEPPFRDVGAFDSRELIRFNIDEKLLPASTPVPAVGIPRQN